MNVIEVKGLKKRYKSVQAVDDIAFSVPEGTIFGMLGPNGAGKTTTIECTIGIKKRDAGQVKVLDLDPAIDYEKLYNMIGVQLQETSYQEKIRVFELCELFTAMYDQPTDYRQLLKRFGLEDKLKSYVTQLSGGQRQKVAIVLALIANPKVVFLDELTTGLDPSARRDMWECVKELKAEGRTIFLTTHYMEEAEYLCDQICIIHSGQIIAMDTIDGVIDQADIPVRLQFHTPADATSVLNGMDGVEDVTQDGESVTVTFHNEQVIGDVIVKLREQNIAYRRLDIRRPNLEDVYLKLTGTAWKEEA